MFLSSDDAKAIADKILARSNADACVVRIDGGEDLSLRFARAGATTNIATSEISLRVSSHIGGRIGSVSTTRLDDDALEAARARSEEIARMLPVDPDYVAPLGPQTYETAARYDDNAASLRLDALASEAAQRDRGRRASSASTHSAARRARGASRRWRRATASSPMSAEAKSIFPPPRATSPTHGRAGPARMNSSARGSMRRALRGAPAGRPRMTPSPSISNPAITRSCWSRSPSPTSHSGC